MRKTSRGAKRILLIRADGGKAMGLAHLTRCVDIIKSTKKRYADVYFLTGQEKVALEYLKEQGFKTISSNEEGKFAGLIKNKFNLNDFSIDIIVDVPNTPQKTVDSFKLVSNRVIYFTDETKIIKIKADIIFAFSPSQKRKYYKETPKTKYYVDPRYAPLDPVFSKSFQKKKKITADQVKNILVSMGGSDATNLTVKVMMALSRIKERFKITVVLGKAFGADNQKALKKYCGRQVIVKKNISNMREEMLGADMGICSAGRTLQEFMCLGIPVVSVPQTKLEAEILKNYGEVAVKVNSFGTRVKVAEIQDAIEKIISNVNLRERISKKAAAAIDGKGIARITKAITSSD